MQTIFGMVTWRLWMSLLEWPCPNKNLKYEKGENRRKHSGTELSANIVFEFGVWVGKCPKNFSLDKAEEILQSGIPEFRKTIPEKPCRIWTYFDGVIYAARTEDGGRTWHGFPAQDPPEDILNKLIERNQSERSRIKQWLRQKWNQRN